MDYTSRLASLQAEVTRELERPETKLTHMQAVAIAKAIAAPLFQAVLAEVEEEFRRHK